MITCCLPVGVTETVLVKYYKRNKFTGTNVIYIVYNYSVDKMSIS